MRKKKGISLIVLVITIIVMIILASTIILSINNSGIIQKANKAVQDTDLAQMKHLATIKWSEGYLKNLRTKDELEKYVLDELAKELKQEKLEDYIIDVTPSGVKVELKDDVSNDDNDSNNQQDSTIVSGVVPDSGKYYVGVTGNELGDYTGATAIYEEGDALPEEVNIGDVYVYGDYEYRYSNNLYYSIITEDFKWTAESFEGWSVAVIDRGKTSYGEVLRSINGANVVNMTSAFSHCYNLTSLEGIIIPDSVINMHSAFSYCTRLSTIGELIIPEGVTDISSAFQACSALKTLEGLSLPNTVTNMASTFSTCYVLETLAGLTLPSNVVNLYDTFDNCIALTSLGNLTIPNTVTNMHGTFQNCDSLTSLEGIIIPSSVANMHKTFFSCGALTGTIQINANPEDYYQCLLGTQVIEITGTTNLKDELLATKQEE